VGQPRFLSAVVELYLFFVLYNVMDTVSWGYTENKPSLLELIKEAETTRFEKTIR